MNLKTITDKMEAARADIQEFGKDELAKEFASFFQNHPEIEAVRWTQYTPHFNDGEPCVFRVGSFYFKTVGEDLTGDDKEEWDRGCGPCGSNPAAHEALEPLRSYAAKEVFRTLFDDGMMVTATRKGFDIEEYDHD